MKIKKNLTHTLVALIGFSISVTGTAVIAGSLLSTGFGDDATFAAPNEEDGVYCNEDDTRYEYIPGFTIANGDNDIIGYIRNSDLEEPLPSSPEDAFRIQEERRKEEARTGRGYSRTVNVYMSDGVTVIDTFTIGWREGDPVGGQVFSKDSVDGEWLPR
jgi:hypothetical protein